MNSYYHNINELNRFYKNLGFKGFKTITPERKMELDKIVSKWYSYCHENKKDDKTLLFMARIARKLSLEPEPFGLKTGDEKAYFFVNIVDPELILLECYECANFKDELKAYCALNFSGYDKRLVVLEKYYNIHFKLFDPQEIWTLERIKKEY